jgi:hypothetical protein
MKIEFIKKTKWNGENFWYTAENGIVVNGTLCFDENQARAKFDEVVARKKSGKLDVSEVIDSVEIE